MAMVSNVNILVSIALLAQQTVLEGLQLISAPDGLD